MLELRSPAPSLELEARKGEKRRRLGEEGHGNFDTICCRPGFEQHAHSKEILRAARWIVHVSSTSPDGRYQRQCSGIFIQWNKKEGRARILTSDYVGFCTGDGKLCDPAPKIDVHLRNNDVVEGYVLFLDEHYQFALVEISMCSSFEVELPSFGCSPCYGQKVFTLARDKDLHLRLVHGTILREEENHLLVLNCTLPPCSSGGTVINHTGDLIGISSNWAICSITTILTCIDMWTRFRCIVRPMLGMCLSTVELLDIVQLDKLWCKYDIGNGFIVDEVTPYSTAEKLGIKEGDVIVSFNGISSCYLPQACEIIFINMMGRSI